MKPDLEQLDNLAKECSAWLASKIEELGYELIVHNIIIATPEQYTSVTSNNADPKMVPEFLRRIAGAINLDESIPFSY